MSNETKRIAFLADVEQLGTAQNLTELVAIVMRAGVPARGASQVIKCIYVHPVVAFQVPVLRRLRAEGVTVDQLVELVEKNVRASGLLGKASDAPHGEWDDAETRAHGQRLADNARHQFESLGDAAKPHVRDFFATECASSSRCRASSSSACSRVTSTRATRSTC